MKEKGVLEDYLKQHKFDPAKKYHFNEYNVAFEPMAYMDVSLSLFFPPFHLCVSFIKLELWCTFSLPCMKS